MLSKSVDDINPRLAGINELRAFLQSDDCHLSRNARCLIVSIAFHWMGPDGLAWPSIQTIARVSGLSRTVVFEAISECVRSGVLVVSKRPTSGRPSNVYQATVPVGVVSKIGVGGSSEPRGNVRITDSTRPDYGPELPMNYQEDIEPSVQYVFAKQKRRPIREGEPMRERLEPTPEMIRCHREILPSLDPADTWIDFQDWYQGQFSRGWHATWVGWCKHKQRMGDDPTIRKGGRKGGTLRRLFERDIPGYLGWTDPRS